MVILWHTWSKLITLQLGVSNNSCHAFSKGFKWFPGSIGSDLIFYQNSLVFFVLFYEQTVLALSTTIFFKNLPCFIKINSTLFIPNFGGRKLEVVSWCKIV